MFAILLLAAAPAAFAPQGPVLIGPGDSLEEVIRKAASVTPSPRQLAWQQVEFAAFVHCGVNTFTDREWGDGREDPTILNPTGLDARQ